MTSRQYKAKEAWLRKNKAAFKAVMRGLGETGKGQFAKSPNLAEDAKLAGKIKG